MRKPMFIIAYSANQGTNMLLQEEEGGPWKFDTDFASADIVPDGPNEGKDQGDDSSLLPGEENHMGGFKVIVKKSATESTVITPPKKDGSYEAPQMFLVPSKWFWPVEQQPIDGVYRGFIPWQSAWWTRRDGICSGNVIQHAWPTFLENNNKKSQ